MGNEIPFFFFFLQLLRKISFVEVKWFCLGCSTSPIYEMQILQVLVLLWHCATMMIFGHYTSSFLREATASYRKIRGVWRIHSEWILISVLRRLSSELETAGSLVVIFFCLKFILPKINSMHSSSSIHNFLAKLSVLQLWQFMQSHQIKVGKGWRWTRERQE